MNLNPGPEKSLAHQALESNHAELVRAIIALSEESVYKNGSSRNGISYKFLARITVVSYLAGLKLANDPEVVEALALLAEQD